jgi:hypothetical protein
MVNNVKLIVLKIDILTKIQYYLEVIASTICTFLTWMIH